MASTIPLYDLKQAHPGAEDELCRVLRRVIRTGRFVMGPELAAFETMLARFLGVDHVRGVNSGTDALVLGLKALDIGPGDEVITTPFTFFATVEAIVRAGAQPVFADVEPDTLCLSAGACAAVVTPRTKAILLVHLFGHCTDVDRFVTLCREHRLHLVEDAAQAIGATWQSRRLGSLGSVACFSFYPTKNLAALGDGGAVATTDPQVAARIDLLRNHGRADDGRHVAWGYNSRLDEIQAAFLAAGLAGLEAGNERRRTIARRYDEELGGVTRVVHGREGCASAHHQYAILTPRRNELHRFLTDAGVETGRYYETPAHLEPVLSGTPPSLPVAEQACRETLTLPIRPDLTGAEQNRIITLVRGFLGPDA